MELDLNETSSDSSSEKPKQALVEQHIKAKNTPSVAFLYWRFDLMIAVSF